jgi:hypothetical protein
VTPLALLTLLAFGAVLVLALAVWTLLAPKRTRPPTTERERPRPRSNDEVRGAKARAEPRSRPASEDAVERFRRAGRDDPP